MQDHSPELRSPQSLMRDLKREAACLTAVVAAVLVMSTCTVLFVLSYAAADGAAAVTRLV